MGFLFYAVVFLGLLVLAAFCYAMYLRLTVNQCLIDPFVTNTQRLDGYYAIITGANSGIGYETAFELAKRGAHVTIACRNEQRGKRAERALNTRLLQECNESKGKTKFMGCDLSKLSTVKKFVKEYIASGNPLHILVNNAGMGSTRRFKQTQDGFEVCLQVNYLGHFFLTHSLTPLLVESSRKLATIGRIVNVSSIWHWHGDVNTDVLSGDVSTQKKAFNGKRIYGTTKLMQIMHAKALQKAFGSERLPVAAFSAHPGFVNTDIFKWERQPPHVYLLFQALYPFVLLASRTPRAGAQSILHCCVDPLKAKQLEPGKYHACNAVCDSYDAKKQSKDDAAIGQLYQWSRDVLNLDGIDFTALTPAIDS